MGNIVAMVIAAVSMPILTRLYSPEAFAGWAVYTSTAQIFSTVACLRYELAILLPKSAEDGARILFGCFLVTLVISACALLIVYLFAEVIIGGSLMAGLSPWLWAMPVLIISFGLNQALNWWCSRTQKFGIYSISQILLPLFTVIVQMGMAIFGYRSYSGLIFGTIAGQCSATICIIYKIFRVDKAIFLVSIRSPRKIITILFNHKNYPIYMTPFTLVSIIRERLMYFLMSSYSNVLDIGYYSLSSRLVNLPNSLISGALRPVFFQQAASHGFSDMASEVLSTMKFIIITVVPFWCLFLYHAAEILAFVFGEKWSAAAPYAVIMSFPIISLIMYNWMDRAFDVQGRQRLAFFFEFIFSGITIILLFGCFRFFNNVFYAISAQSFTMVVYNMSLIVAIFKISKFPLRTLLAPLILFCSLFCASMCITFVFSSLFKPWIAIILNGLFIAIVIGCCMHKRFNHLIYTK